MERKLPVILVIDSSVDVTGALKSIAQCCDALRANFQFVFLIPANSRARKWIEDQKIGKVEELPMRELNRKIVSLLLYFPSLVLNAFRLRSLIGKREVSIVHANDLYNLLPAALCMLGFRIRYVCHVRFLPEKFPRWLFDAWLRLNLRYSMKVIAVSNSLLKQLPIHPKLEMIHSVMAFEERLPPATRKATSNILFLYLSNFIAGKGHEYALRAFASLRHELPQARLRFVGSDMGLVKNQEYRAYLIKLAHELEVWHMTEWSDYVAEVEHEYKSADVFLNFSESESFSMTCAEASFYGCPVIATRSGGPTEIVEHGKSGLLVANCNIEEMRSAMRQLAMNHPLRLSMSSCGRETIRQKFDHNSTAGKLLAVYNSIL